MLPPRLQHQTAGGPAPHSSCYCCNMVIPTTHPRRPTAITTTTATTPDLLCGSTAIHTSRTGQREAWRVPCCMHVRTQDERQNYTIFYMYTSPCCCGSTINTTYACPAAVQCRRMVEPQLVSSHIPGTRYIPGIRVLVHTIRAILVLILLEYVSLSHIPGTIRTRTDTAVLILIVQIDVPYRVETSKSVLSCAVSVFCQIALNMLMSLLIKSYFRLSSSGLCWHLSDLPEVPLKQRLLQLFILAGDSFSFFALLRRESHFPPFVFCVLGPFICAVY